MFGAQPLEDIAAEFYHNLAQQMAIKDTSTHDTEFRLADVVGCQTPAFLAIRQLLRHDRICWDLGISLTGNYSGKRVQFCVINGAWNSGSFTLEALINALNQVKGVLRFASPTSATGHRKSKRDTVRVEPYAIHCLARTECVSQIVLM